MIKNKECSFFSLLVMSLLVTSESFAEDPVKEELTVLEEVTVTDTRVEKGQSKLPISVGAVDKDDIQFATQQTGLDESLVKVPGIFMQNRYNFAQDLRVSIRGFGARSSFGIRGIKVIVDGIPESAPDGQANVDSIDLGSAERIEVIRGPVSSLYGNASGGCDPYSIRACARDPFHFGSTKLW